MSKERKTLNKIYGHRYKKITSKDIKHVNDCLYCGDVYTEYDHQPPLSTVDGIGDRSVGIEYALIPSCSECNRLLGNSLTYTVNERFELLKTLLRAKHSKILSVTAEKRDYSDMTGHLKRQCVAYDKKGEEIRRRLRFEGYEHDGQKISDVELYMYEGQCYDTYFDALKAACDTQGVDYSKVLRYCDNKAGNDIDNLISDYRHSALVNTTKKTAKAVKKERYKSMPLKIINGFIDNFAYLYGKPSDILALIDVEYEKYLDRMNISK